MPAEKTCPRCDGPMSLKDGRKGAFWGCRRYPQCEGTRDLSDDSNDVMDPQSVVRLDSEQLSEVLVQLNSIAQAVGAATNMEYMIGELTSEVRNLNRLLGVFALNKIREWERKQEQVTRDVEQITEDLTKEGQ